MIFFVNERSCVTTYLTTAGTKIYIMYAVEIESFGAEFVKVSLFTVDNNINNIRNKKNLGYSLFKHVSFFILTLLFIIMNCIT